MKILYIAADTNKIGGIEKYNRELMSALQESGADIFFAPLYGTGILQKISFVLRVFLKFLSFWPDVIICGHINFAPLGYLNKKIFRKNYVVLTYGIDVWNINKNQIKYLKNAKIISTISAYTKSRILTAAPELKSKIFILPNAIDGDKFRPKQKSEELAKKLGVENSKVILTICRLAKSEGYKGYDKIIQTLPDVVKEIKNVKYVLAGEGDDTERIKQLIKDLKMEDYVVMPGYIPEKELVNYYNLCDVFVMPSKGEGFGFVFLEALACGKPVIAGNQDGSVDAVLNGKLGILVNPDKIEEISKAIISVLRGEVLADLLSSNYLRENVLESYGFNKFKEKVKNLIYELSR